MPITYGVELSDHTPLLKDDTLVFNMMNKGDGTNNAFAKVESDNEYEHRLWAIANELAAVAKDKTTAPNLDKILLQEAPVTSKEHRQYFMDCLTEAFKDTPWKIASDVGNVTGNQFGNLTLYDESKLKIDEGLTDEIRSEKRALDIHNKNEQSGRSLVHVFVERNPPPGKEAKKELVINTHHRASKPGAASTVGGGYVEADHQPDIYINTQIANKHKLPLNMGGDLNTDPEKLNTPGLYVGSTPKQGSVPLSHTVDPVTRKRKQGDPKSVDGIINEKNVKPVLLNIVDKREKYPPPPNLKSASSAKPRKKDLSTPSTSVPGAAPLTGAIHIPKYGVLGSAIKEHFPKLGHIDITYAPKNNPFVQSYPDGDVINSRICLKFLNEETATYFSSSLSNLTPPVNTYQSNQELYIDLKDQDAFLRFILTKKVAEATAKTAIDTTSILEVAPSGKTTDITRRAKSFFSERALIDELFDRLNKESGGDTTKHWILTSIEEEGKTRYLSASTLEGERFQIYPNKMVTNSQTPDTMVVMLKAFRAVHGDEKFPTIHCHLELVDVWAKACTDAGYSRQQLETKIKIREAKMPEKAEKSEEEAELTGAKDVDETEEIPPPADVPPPPGFH